MSEKTTVITGATSGIGRETAFALANLNHAIYMLVRNTEKGEQLRQTIIGQTGNRAIYVIKCDLTDLDSVHEAADQLKSRLTDINVLINDAGGMFNKKELSKDGFEMTFALNHLGHFTLTMDLMPLLEKGHARIINVSSDAHKAGKADFDSIRGEKPYSGVRAYANAKLFNIYFTESLADKYAGRGISAFSLHPGLVKTNFGSDATGFARLMMWLSKPFMISAKKGAKTAVYLATKPKLEMKNGSYFKKCKKTRPAAQAKDFSARNRLWNLSMDLIGVNKDQRQLA